MSRAVRQELVSTRIELDPQYDIDLQRLADLEVRSKRQMGAVLIRRIVRMWRDNPALLTEHRIVQPNP